MRLLSFLNSFYKLLFSASSAPSHSWRASLLSFHCTQWLYIIEAALPFHFHGTNSKLHPSKMETGGGGGGGGGAGFGCSFKRHSASCCWEKRAWGKQGGCLLSPPPLNIKRKCYPDMMGISKMAVQRSESMQRQIALPYAGLVKTSIVTSVRGWHLVRIFQKASTLDYSWKKAPVIFILLQSRTQIQYWYTDSFSFWKFKFSALPQWLTSTATSLLSPSLTHNPIGSYFCPTRNSCNFMFAISRGADGPEKRNKFFFRQSRSFATQWDSGGRTEGRW